MSEQRKRVLIYGYGNPGRQDDALGNEMVKKVEEWIEKHNLVCMDTDSNYQLNIEDAERISNWEIVVFVDASREGIHEYKFCKMHAVSPSYVLHLSEKLFNKKPDAYVLGIKGYEWEFKEGLSDNAKLNLEQAFQFLTRQMADWAVIKKNLPISMLNE